jgi:siroheme synthase (precorrin-2 oxidase/ferrochelatase)
MPSRPALAVSLFVAGRRCVVVGEGAPADERAARLDAAGAEVVRVPAAAFRPEALDDAFMVFCCDAASGPRVSAAARARRALVYVLDAPDASDLAMPALARRGPLQLAISTDGTAPALARRLRQELERLLTSAAPELDALLAEMARVRDQLPAGDRRDRLTALAATLSLTGAFKIV